jgi:hypothetical protein
MEANRIFTTTSGSLTEHGFCSSERYAFDFNTKGWKQYDTKDDAWYFGIWYHPGKRQIVQYMEGDVYLITSGDWEEFKAEMKDMDRFYGDPPPCIIAGDGIDLTNGGALTNPKLFYDAGARLDYDQPEPEKEEPIMFDQVWKIFAGIEIYERRK